MRLLYRCCCFTSRLLRWGRISQLLADYVLGEVCVMCCLVYHRADVCSCCTAPADKFLHDVQVAALEGRILRLLADCEVVAVTAGRQAEAEAAAALQQAQEHLAAVEKVTHALHKLLA
jgi:hypothetical protein